MAISNWSKSFSGQLGGKAHCGIHLFLSEGEQYDFMKILYHRLETVFALVSTYYQTASFFTGEVKPQKSMCTGQMSLRCR